MSIPMIDFRACTGLQLDSTIIAQPTTDAVLMVAPGAAEPPDIVVWTNVLDEPIDIEVIDVASLFRDAPNDLVEALFLRQWMTDGEEASPFRMAEPCMSTGETLFRATSCAIPMSDRANAVLDYLLRKAENYSLVVTLCGGEGIAVDNRRQAVRFTDPCQIELSFAYTEDMGEDNFASQKEPDNGR